MLHLPVLILTTTHQNITTLQNFALTVIRTKLKTNENIHKYEDCVILGYHTASLGIQFMAFYSNQLPSDTAVCNRRSDFSDTLLWKPAVEVGLKNPPSLYIWFPLLHLS